MSLTPTAIGYPEIDRQHADLVHCVNALGALENKVSGQYRVERLLTGLLDKMISHFRTEEGAMRALELDDDLFAAHCRAHALILEAVQATIEMGKTRGYNAADVHRIAEGWVHEHLLTFDEPLRHLALLRKQFSK